ncbi:plasmid partitioning protein RepB [Ancylobacter pratisalsi]|uniref:Plasmid partitioning protein RepB n=1 Tax=Ancylobacter pratisalsi TaxID=1745854 RepID=A0A6P1YSG6_9HYPH|nr:plasmid partitioning protein RepB [Ancylobacter pratisalsi]QIB36457.1 plasmid partitioning protein RepB [Ancylobacter pratisalsi]
MSKRTQSIRSMFAGRGEGELSADNKPSLPRVTAGAVRSLKETFTDVERDYQALREQLSNGAIVVELDPTLVDPSPFTDRIQDQDESSFEELKRSIAERGQEIPILVRPHPSLPGRYQSAYGHRRVRAVRDLGVQVKAYVRPLTDEDLVVSQGIENSAREDLSFIERALFALRLEGAGFQRTVVQSALTIDRAEASKLIAVAKAIPADLVAAIGRAPKVGRGRWQSLAELLQDAVLVERARELIARPDFRTQSTGERFDTIYGLHKTPAPLAPATQEQTVRSRDGTELATLVRSKRIVRLQIDRQRNEAFADFVLRKLPDLYDLYTQERSVDE